MAVLLNNLLIPSGALNSFFEEQEKTELIKDVKVTAEW